MGPTIHSPRISEPIHYAPGIVAVTLARLSNSPYGHRGFAAGTTDDEVRESGDHARSFDSLIDEFW